MACYLGISMSVMISKANPWRFFVLALGISWFFWIWVILLGWNVFTFPAIILGALGLFGPAIAEIVLISLTHDKEEWRDYWQRVFDIRRIGKRWHLVIWLTFPVLNTLALLLSVLAGSPWPEFETARNLMSEPWRILPFVVFILLYGPLPEELGWRGYALDGLQARYNALFSSLILSVVWACGMFLFSSWKDNGARPAKVCHVGLLELYPRSDYYFRSVPAHHVAPV